MTVEFKLPELGENIDSADIIKVLVVKGDKVDKDQILLEIETDKATIEVPSEVNGIVKEVLVKEGDSVKVGQALITFDGINVESKIEETKSDDPKEEQVAIKQSEIQKSNIKPQKQSESPGGTVEFKLPELGENISSADITKVMVSIGDKVEADQIVLEIETDKATVEVPTEISGIIKEVRVKEGEAASVGDVIFVIELTGESKPVQTIEKVEEIKVQESVGKTTEKKTTIKSEEINAVIERVTPAVVPSRDDMPSKIAPAAPSVRRFAREIGINIHQVGGSGPGGRISIEDVKAYAKNVNEKIQKGISGTAIGISTEPLPDFSKWGEIERKLMSNVRKKTAEHLSYAWASIPHVTQFDKADITELEKIRKQLAHKTESAGGKLTVTAILLKIAASALKVFPQFNSSIDMEKKEIIYKKYFHIGIAVDTDRGLIVPVIRDVDKKNIIELAAELNVMSEKARNKKISLEEMQGGCFTISNLGGIGGTYFSPVVNSPEVAILGVSKGSYEPVFKDGNFEPRLMLPLSLSYDHRIIDGADGVRFLKWIVSALEQLFLLSLEG